MKKNTILALLLLAAAFCFSPSANAQNTTLAQWNFNTTNSTNYLKPSSGTNLGGTVLGYGQSAPSTPLTSIIFNGSLDDPGTFSVNQTYNRAAIVNPPLTSANNTSVGVLFRTPTTGMAPGEAVQISWSQAVGFRSSRYWQILVSTTGSNNATYTVPSAGTGSSISTTISGLNSANATISGTASVSVNSLGLVDFRTIDGLSLNPAQVTGTPGNVTATLAVGFVDNITFTLPTGQGYENCADFGFAIVGAWDPSIVATSGTTGLVSSFSGNNSLDGTTGYNRSLASGGSMRLDLVTISAVPEPATVALIATVAILFSGLALRRRKTNSAPSHSPSDIP